MTWYGGLPPRSIDSFDTLIERFSVQYATSRSHCMTLAALASLRQADDESLRKFIGKFGRTVVQIRNLNPEIKLHSMLLALHPSKFVDSLCKKLPGSMDEPHERAKGYIQIEEMSKFWNEVYQVKQKCERCKANTKTDLHKSDKRHKLDKRQPLSKRPGMSVTYH